MKTDPEPRVEGAECLSMAVLRCLQDHAGVSAGPSFPIPASSLQSLPMGAILVGVSICAVWNLFLLIITPPLSCHLLFEALPGLSPPHTHTFLEHVTVLGGNTSVSSPGLEPWEGSASDLTSAWW